MVSQSVSRLIETLARRRITPLSIDEIICRGAPGARQETQSCLTQERLIKNAQWIQQELPLRLAHRIYDFHRLPYAVVSDPNINKVYDLYVSSLLTTQNVGPITNREEENSFTQKLTSLISLHREVVRFMQQGVRTLKATYEDLALDDFLSCLFSTRIGNRLMAEHHCALHDDEANSNLSNSDFVGVINQRCKPVRIIDNTAKAVQEIAMSVYGRCPEILIEGDPHLTFPYVPEHLRYLMMEALKNAVRATLDHNFKQEAIPPVNVSVLQGSNHVCINISDNGGGVPLEVCDDIWSYGVTTFEFGKFGGGNGTDCSRYRNIQRFVGYGFGLPLSRLYAEYFGGTFKLISQPGIGCSVYIMLPCVGDQKEPVQFLNNNTMRLRNSLGSDNFQLRQPFGTSVLDRVGGPSWAGI